LTFKYSFLTNVKEIVEFLKQNVKGIEKSPIFEPYRENNQPTFAFKVSRIF
jgi:hypothetical protein